MKNVEGMINTQVYPNQHREIWRGRLDVLKRSYEVEDTFGPENEKEAVYDIGAAEQKGTASDKDLDPTIAVSGTTSTGSHFITNRPIDESN